MAGSAKAIYVSHGGGPLPLLGDPGHAEMVESLQDIAARIEQPNAIVVVSAHWEEPVTSVTSAPNPGLLYDYYNFPDEAYQIEYPCPGEPELAADIGRMLSNAGIATRFEVERGLDHGLFVPLKIMYPQADIPCVQLSLTKSLDPAHHIAVGKALSSLSDDNVVVIGSGFSFHNMRGLRDSSEESRQLNESFEYWLRDVCGNKTISERERAAALEQWRNAPGAAYCHPREEHLIPLHVCYGVAETACTEAISLRIMNKSASMFIW